MFVKDACPDVSQHRVDEVQHQPDRGRAQVLLEIGIGADHRIHSIDITGDADRLHRVILALPDRASREHRSIIG
jgi:hypothetical protein